jgi:hypothetical protein
MMIGLYHYIAASLFAGFALLELIVAGRNFPPVTHWRLKGTAFMLLYFALATYAPLFWDGWLGQYRLLAADTLPLWLQFVGGFLAFELGVYAWHRTMHNTPFLWRWFHQMHHSAERVDIWGSLYFHPFDTLGFTFVGSLALVLGFGVSAEAAILINVLATSTACSSTPTSRRRTGWATSSSGRKVIRAITSAACMRAIIRTCRCGTWSSARSIIRRPLTARSASMTAARSGSATCCAAA